MDIKSILLVFAFSTIFGNAYIKDPSQIEQLKKWDVSLFLGS